MTSVNPVKAPSGEQPTASAAHRSESAAARVLRAQKPGQWVLTVLVLLIVVFGINSVARNSGFQWGVVGQYLFASSIMQGLLRTLELTVIGAAIGFVGGVILAVMRLSGALLPDWAARIYIWFFRGTPLMVQLIFWYNVGALYQHISFGVPYGPALFRLDSNSVITPFSAAILGLGLNAAAYMSEIVRAGIQSIHHGQTEAAHALGLSRTRTFWHILLPQAMRVIVPPASNEIIGMLKYTSLVSVLSVPELLYSAQLIYARTFQTIPLLLVACAWYLFVTTLLTIGQHYLEKRYARGIKSGARPVIIEVDPGGSR